MGDKSGIEWTDALVRETKGRGAKGNTPVLPGESNPAAILTRTQVDTIRERIANGHRRKALAAEHGVSVSTIHAIARREIWQ